MGRPSFGRSCPLAFSRYSSRAAILQVITTGIQLCCKVVIPAVCHCFEPVKKRSTRLQFMQGMGGSGGRQRWRGPRQGCILDGSALHPPSFSLHDGSLPGPEPSSCRRLPPPCAIWKGIGAARRLKRGSPPHCGHSCSLLAPSRSSLAHQAARASPTRPAPHQPAPSRPPPRRPPPAMRASRLALIAGLLAAAGAAWAGASTAAAAV